MNLVLGLSVSALGFQIKILLKKEINPVSWQKWVFLFALLDLLASTRLGIWCVINQLLTFRATTQVARMREQEKSETEMDPYRTLYGKVGKKHAAFSGARLLRLE